MDMMQIRRRMMLNVPQVKTASGTSVSFHTDIPADLISCEAYFSAVQQGSGSPSPGNPRPLSGWDAVSLYVSGADTGSPAVYTAAWSSAGTLYGGHIDLMTGTLYQTHGFATFVGAGSEDWKPDGSARYYIPFPGVKLPSNWARYSVLSNIGLFSASSSPTYTIFAYNYNNTAYLSPRLYYYPPSSVTSAAEFKTWLASNHMQVVYELRDPVTYTLTPVQIRALAGENNVWNSAGGNMTLKYLSTN